MIIDNGKYVLCDIQEGVCITIEPGFRVEPGNSMGYVIVGNVDGKRDIVIRKDDGRIEVIQMAWMYWLPLGKIVKEVKP